MSDLIGLSMVIFLAGLGVGVITNSSSIRGDCEELGKFRGAGEVYICKLQRSEEEKQ